MHTVLCFKWGTKYSSQYVNNLYRAVERNTTVPVRFVCVTDDPSGFDPNIQSFPLLDPSLEGWWQKITAFACPLYDIVGTVLLIDLDMVIVDNIDCFFTHPGSFIMEQDYLPQNGLSTCVMRFTANNHSDIYNNITPLDTKTCWGDQVWVTNNHPVGWNWKHLGQRWPLEWVKSYKWECITDNDFAIPEGCKIIKFHGIPTIVDTLPLNHINKYWDSDE